MTSSWTSPLQEMPATEEKRSGWTAIALGLTLLTATFIAHFPATHSGYIWDDNVSLHKNILVKAPDGLYKFWFTSQTLDYWPLTSTSYWLEWRIWGNNPKPYHVTNIALHALAAVVLWRVLKRLGLSDLGAFLGGLLFAVHPVTVETVAWIAERKNVLSMLLYLLSILAYLRFEDENRRAWYIIALLAAAAALLAKTSVVALPIVLLMLSWWRHREFSKRSLLRMAPFFLLSLVLGLVTIRFQHNHAIAGVIVRPEGLASRIASVGWITWFYLYKLIAPVNLLMVYPRWDINSQHLRSFLPLIALIACLLILWRYRNRWGRGPLIALGSFVVVLAPVLGVLEMSYTRFSLVADHLQYPGMPGVMALAGGSIATAWAWARGKNSRALALTVAAPTVAILLSLPLLTWRQACLYADDITLWSHVISHNAGAWVAYNNRGGAYGGIPDYDRAISDFSKVIELKPDYAEAHYNRGNVYGRMADYIPAIRDFSKAIELNSDYLEAFFNRGNSYRGKAELDKAISDYSRVIELQPSYMDAYYNRGITYGMKGDLDRALQDYTHAIQMRGDFADAYHNRGNVYRAKGNLPRAFEEFSKAIALKPDLVDAYYDRGNAYAAIHDAKRAIADYTKVIELKPAYADAYNNRGALYSGMGNFTSAIHDHDRAIELKPNSPSAFNNRGNAYMAINKTDLAIRDYSQAVALDPAYIDGFFNRGIAHKSVEHLTEALQDFTRVIELNPEEADAFGNRAVVHFLVKQYDRAWADIKKCRQFGGQVSPDFLRDLAAASGRTD